MIFVVVENMRENEDENRFIHTLVVPVAGGLFHGDDGITQLAFKNTVEKMNARSGFYQLTPIVLMVPRTDTYKAQKVG